MGNDRGFTTQHVQEAQGVTNIHSSNIYRQSSCVIKRALTEEGTHRLKTAEEGREGSTGSRGRTPESGLGDQACQGSMSAASHKSLAMGKEEQAVNNRLQSVLAAGSRRGGREEQDYARQLVKPP